MEYQIIRACAIAGQKKAAGDVVTLDDKTARELMAIGRVVPHDKPKVDNRAIGLDEETKPRKRGRPRAAKAED